MSIQDASSGLLPSSEAFLQPMTQWLGAMERCLLLAHLRQREYMDPWMGRCVGGVPLDG